MERDQMSRLVIGLGFREQATAQSIGEVLSCVIERAAMLDAEKFLAVVDDKAAHPGLIEAARASRFRVEAVTPEAMQQADARITTRSERVASKRGVGSVCEATALAAAGPAARLVVTRMVSADRTATAAAALIEGTAP
jgi:cobalt-precorrin 5A hydrolase